MKKITILVPAYNEAKNLPELVARLDSISSQPIYIRANEVVAGEVDMSAYEWEYLFVNDGSADNTLNVLADLREDNKRVNYVNLSRNFGKENALLAGMDFSSGDAVIIMDADGQDPVEVIPEMVYWWQQGYDDVYGRRSTRGKESWLRKRLSLTFYRILQGTTRIDILPNVGDFRLLSRRAIEAIISMRESKRYTKGLYCWVGFNKREVIFERANRNEGKSSFNMLGLFNLAIEGITCFTTTPLRISSIIGLIISLLALALMLFYLFKTIVWGETIQGFPTLICTILFLGGIQLLALGIIGEYIGRIFDETKNRPVYFVESLNGEKK